MPGLFCWGYRPVQARMLAVSRTKSLHDAVTQMADDLYGGYAPQPHFNKLKPLHGVLHQLVAVKDDRERTVVQKLNLHIRTEPACLHVGYAFALTALLDDILVQLVCHIG